MCCGISTELVGTCIVGVVGIILTMIVDALGIVFEDTIGIIALGSGTTLFVDVLVVIVVEALSIVVDTTELKSTPVGDFRGVRAIVTGAAAFVESLDLLCRSL